MKSFEYSVPTAIVAGSPAVSVGRPSHVADPDSVLIKAPSTNTANVYVGGPDVTTANGYPLAPGDPAIGMDANATEDIYAISTGSQKLRILKKYTGQTAP